MAYNASGLTPIGGQSKRGRAPQIFAYRTTDSAATVDSANYFASAINSLEIGDVILRTTVDSITAPTSVTSVGFHVVRAKSLTAGTIDVADATAINVSNTD